jgi:hypothetical protein
MQVLTRDELWQLLEDKRFQDLERKKFRLSGQMVALKRCPKCTLEPPCNHYESTVMLGHEAEQILNTDSYKKAIAPAKR